MLLEAFDVDCGEWSCRANVFASATADAALRIDYRELQRIRVVGVFSHHFNGTVRAVASAVAALLDFLALDFHADDAAMFNPYSLADLGGNLFGQVQRQNSASGANLRALVALRTAIAIGVVHYRLHERLELGAGLKNARRALADAKFASDATSGEIVPVL